MKFYPTGIPSKSSMLSCGGCVEAAVVVVVVIAVEAAV